MKKINISLVSFFTGATIIALAGVIAAPASTNALALTGSASVGIGASSSASSTREARIEARASVQAQLEGQRMTVAKSRADQEITRRVSALNDLVTRLAGLKNISDSEKASISADAQAQISVLNTLKTTIDADNSTTTLRTEIQSITKSYRIFALIVPRDHLVAAADRIITTADLMTGLGVKIQARITSAQTAGKDVTALVAALSKINAKAADAKAQAQAAISGISGLTPDNGDQIVAASNKAALVAARAKIKTGTDDLKTAQKDIKTILAGLKAFHLETEASATSTATTTNQ